MRKTLVRHFVESTLGVVSSVLGTIVVFVIVSRALGPELFGQFAFTYAITSLIGLTFDYGYPVSLLRDTRRPENSGLTILPRQAFILKAILLLLLSLVVLVIHAFLGTDPLLAAGLWIGIALISGANFFASMLRALEMHGKDALHNFSANIAGLLVALAVFVIHPAAETFALVYIPIGVIYLSLTLRLWRQHCRLDATPAGPRMLWAETRKNFVYALDALTRRSFGYLDVAILGFIAPFETVGLYQAAQRVTQSVSIFAQPFNNVLLPRLSQATGDAAGFRRKARRAFIIQLFFGAAAGTFVLLAGPHLLILLFSDRFAAANDLLIYFSILIAARYLTSAITISKTAQGFIRERLYANLFGIAILAMLGPVLCWWMGAAGLLIALILSTLLAALFLVLRTKGRPASP